MNENKEKRKLNLANFNISFENEKRQRKMKEKIREKKTLDKLNQEYIEKPISKLTIGELLINSKNAWFAILDDLIQLNLKNIFKDNRLFYIGFTIIIYVLLTYIYEMIIMDYNHF
jgi:hypothetical protein